MASRFWVGGTGTWDASDTTHWAASSNGAGGQSVPGSGDTVTFDASSGGGTVTVNTTVAVTSITGGAFTGTLDFATNDNNVTLSTLFDFSGSGTRTLNLGDGTWTLTAATGTVWTIATTTNLTFNANASSIVLSATATANRAFTGGALTYNNLTVSNAAVNSRQIQIVGNITFANLTLTNVRQFLVGTVNTLTVTGTFTYDGSPASVGFMGSAGSAGTISVANATTLNWLSIGGITKAGAGSITAVNSFDAGGNTSITISSPGKVFGG